MSIVGIGTDIIEIDRIIVMPDNTRERLAVRVLTPDEYQHYVVLKAKAEHNAVRYLAKRWAGKEATSKALGTGIAAGVSFQHIEIKNLVLSHELPDLILKSKMVISRSGYSSLMDYYFLKNQALLIPTPGQTEQVYLAEKCKSEGSFYSVNQDSYFVHSA